MQDTRDISRLFRPWDIVVSAVFLTRLPLPRAPDSAFERARDATWSYPLVGGMLGLCAAVIWWISGLAGFGTHIQAGLSLASIVILTGGLHEDGLADTADGLWGGHDPARRLDIMKDSRIGSYGVLALIFGIALRWFALVLAGPWAFIAALCLSRAVLPGMISVGTFARDTGLAHSLGKPPRHSAGLALGLGFAITALCTGVLSALLCSVLVVGLAWASARLAARKIGGITGDILGATQQLSELAILLAVIATF